MNEERICLECPLFQCVEGQKGCEYTQITRIKARLPRNRKIWRRNVAKAREVRSGRAASGMKKYDRRFKYAKKV